MEVLQEQQNQENVKTNEINNNVSQNIDVKNTEKENDEVKYENAIIKAMKKMFGGENKQNDNDTTNKITNNIDKEQFDKMQKSIDDLTKQNTLLVERQKLNSLKEDLQKNGFEVKDEDFKTSNNIGELKRKILTQETKQDYSKENDDFVNGVFTAIMINKQNQNSNSQQQTQQIAQAVSSGAQDNDPQYFPQRFAATRPSSTEDERSKLKKKYGNV